jgi:hypothetical protein
MSEFIGPPLPPGLRSEEKKEAAVIGPDKSIGPRLPPNLSTANASDASKLKNTAAAASFCGPSLPSGSVTFASNNDLPVSSTSTASGGSGSYGPCLPPGFGVDIRSSKEDGEEPLSDSRIIGPPLPPGVSATETEGDEGGGPEEGEDEDDVIGPMPMVGGVNEAESTIRRRREFDYRSKAMKDKLLGKVHVHTHTLACMVTH